MAIYVTDEDKIIVQGMTGSQGMLHTQLMLEGGTNVVAGVNPRKGGSAANFVVQGRDLTLPICASVQEAKEQFQATASVIFVPPAFAKDAVLEAIDAGLKKIVVITEGIPVADSVIFVSRAREAGVRLIGPNCPGIISPGKTNLGITPANIAGPGPVGLVSKSGTLTYQMMHELRDVGLSTSVGIGGDPVSGTSHVDALSAFEQDPETEVIVLIGEIGGQGEENAAKFIAANVSKPVVAYIAGFHAPEGKTMGHAGAIVSDGSGSASSKKEALEAAGVLVGETLTQTAKLARNLCVK